MSKRRDGSLRNFIFSDSPTAPRAEAAAPESELAAPHAPVANFAPPASLAPGADRALAIAKIVLPASQPRRYFDPEKLEQLAQSVRKHGVLEPLLVRPRANGVYELVAGERRYRAAQLADFSEVPVVVRDLDDEEALQLSLVENLQREDLNPVEETEGILQLLALRLEHSIPDVVALLYRLQNEAKDKVTRNVTGSSEGEAIATVFSELGGMNWQSFVRNRLPLRNLPTEVLEALRQGKLAYTKALAIAKLGDPDQRAALLAEAVEQSLSLAQIRDRVAELMAAQQAPPLAPSKRLKHRFDETYRKLKQAKIWNSQQKQQRVEQLLGQIESLVAES